MKSKSQRGGVAVTFGLLLIPMLLFTALGIDYLRASNAKQSLQSLLDAAILAAAAEGADADVTKMKEIVDKYVKGNIGTTEIIPDSVVVGTLNVDAKTVGIQVSGRLPTTFMRVAQINDLPITVKSEGLQPEDAPVQVVLVLDTTYSMSETFGSGSRMDALKSATNSMLDKIMPDDTKGISVGLVPFNQFVNISTIVPTWTDYKDPKPVFPGWFRFNYPDDWDLHRQIGCAKWQENCPMVEVIRDRVPVMVPKCKCYEAQYADLGFLGCVVMRPPPLNGASELDPNDDLDKLRGPGPIVQVIGSPLAHCYTPAVRDLIASDATVVIDNKTLNGREAIKSYINGMKVSTSSLTFETFIPEGLWWGWNMLDPGEPFSSAVAANATNEGLRNVLVLVTDGDNTTTLKPKGNNITGYKPDVPSTDDLTKRLCENIKNQEIEIYTIGFDLKRQSTIDILKGCASSPDMAVVVTNTSQLEKAFERIGTDLTKLRLLN